MDDRLRQLLTLGREHFQAREYEQAEKCLSEVVKEHRGFADIFNILGLIYHQQGRFEHAQEAFEEAIRINPNYTEAALNLAVTYNDLGKYAQAREIYSRTIARSHASPRCLDSFARGKIANMHADLGAAYAGIALYSEAVNEYRKALELCPTFADLRTRLANVYRDMGDLQAALVELEIVKQQNPRYVPGRVSLGVTLFSLGRRDEAQPEWEAALAFDPQHKAAKFYMQMVRDERVRGGAEASANPAGSPDRTDESAPPSTTGAAPKTR